MIMIFVIGVLVDSLVFGKAEHLDPPPVRIDRRDPRRVDSYAAVTRARASRRIGWSGTRTFIIRLSPNTVIRTDGVAGKNHGNRYRRRADPRQDRGSRR